jgi:uncharacterized membrane protein
MMQLDQALLVLHFIGLTLGLSVSFASIAMQLVMAKSAPADRAVLARFPPVMSRFGKAGLALLWVTGLTLLFTKWGGFGVLPWTFHVKLTAVVLLTITVGVIHRFEGRVRAGDASAIGKIQTAGKVAMALALVAVIFAVLTFN